MERKFKVTVDGMPYMVSVEELTSADQRLSQSVAHPAAVSMPVAPVAASVPAPVPTARIASGETGDEKLSPLAGVVVSVEVSVGQAVNDGDRVATIEAMKMKTAIVAHKAGTVTHIHVKAGDGVEAGQPLMTIS